MKFIDFFAGIGGFRRGMELAGHECVGFCEFDKFATASYTSMHLITEGQREFLNKMPLKHRQKEILKEEYRNGEWYANDIRRVYAGDIPKADCWCFGFPCQDISVAGKQLGFQGNRSSLFFRDIAISAIGKQIPKKPIRNSSGDLACLCGLIIQIKSKRKCLYFCHNCGQAIKWGDDD